MGGVRPCVLLALVVLPWGCPEALEVVSDTEMLSLMQEKQYLLVLFTKGDCKVCERMEDVLEGIRGHLRMAFEDSLKVVMVRSSLVRNYRPEGEPALVFFRYGSAMLYEELEAEDVMLSRILQGKEPATMELTDASFEHLTKAATGPLLVMFYTPECVMCSQLRARWEALAVRVAGRINVGMLNAKGTVTGRRFNIDQYPTIILYNFGKMYRYNSRTYDIHSFISFVTYWLKDLPAEDIPDPRTTLTHVWDAAEQLAQDYPLTLKLASGIIFMCILLLFYSKPKVACAHLCCHGPKKQQAQMKAD